ncbi:hypothetical protein RRG08_057532 [Elysia crispata]|uniref:Uncharacterized protein n=1 Tax=Elysia crispata TaxID=231223 RepID=A0AAE1EAA0_9GAST|nr:hypothetical protein RRG08_057532 [Elysia crispata]
MARLSEPGILSSTLDYYDCPGPGVFYSTEQEFSPENLDRQTERHGKTEGAKSGENLDRQTERHGKTE